MWFSYLETSLARTGDIFRFEEKILNKNSFYGRFAIGPDQLVLIWRFGVTSLYFLLEKTPFLNLSQNEENLSREFR